MIQHVAFVVFVQNGESTNSLEKENNELRETPRVKRLTRAASNDAKCRLHARTHTQTRTRTHGASTGTRERRRSRRRNKREGKSEEEGRESVRKRDFLLPFLHVFFD